MAAIRSTSIPDGTAPATCGSSVISLVLCRKELRHVEQNPCRAFMVSRPEQCRWSSTAADLSEGKDRSGLLDLEFWSKAGGAETWREMHGGQGVV